MQYTHGSKKRRRRIVAVIVIILIAISAGAYGYVQSALQPLNAKSSEQIEVTIKKGTSTSGIGELLEEKQVIQSGIIFTYYVQLYGKSGLQAGTYLLSPSMDVKEVVEYIASGKIYNPVRYKVTLPEGTQLVEIADMIATEFQLNKEDVLSELNDTSLLKKLQARYPTLITDKIFQSDIKYPLEGYLYPATYSYYEKEYTMEGILSPMLEKTAFFIDKYAEAMKEQKLDAHQLLTLSSLIEEEATEDVDRKMIASVFYNRLHLDMRLQTDPTVLYALGKHKARVLYEDLKVESPYNTYVIKGLPVGPIANSGEMSIQAALEPAHSDYLYFLAAPTGEVFFSKTLQEHNELKNKYITNNNS